MFRIKLKLKIIINKLNLSKKAEKTSAMAGHQSITSVILGMLVKWIIIAFFGAIVLFPFYYMLSYALMSDTEVADTLHVHLAPKKPMWENFGRAFESGYWKAVWFTLAVTTLSIVIKLFVTMLAGYAFSLPKWRGKKILWLLFLSLMMLPEVALLTGQLKIMVDFGWDYGKQVILALVVPFAASVFSAIMFRNAFLAIPSRIKEASLVDGANGAKYFWKVAVPMISPTIWTVGILTAFAAWNSYLWPSLLLAGQEDQVINTWVFTTGFPKTGTDTRILANVRMAAAILAILPMFITYFVMRGRIMRAISRQGSAIKG
ncbi:carbohydrate ABC transporter permease [Mycoplasma marinum]|uniref:Carbohydrate ABC transporter permease n=1 Tax=Mycoplasma marinum TaxID=1937190 RepID=A0A4R0XW54_9MOLU|nr:carbohydrate ABC transporter permease [Mycoplasma marinum]TCG12047.1 carbohydrate ABC transporter permease [Mycoplasma marinum]